MMKRVRKFVSLPINSLDQAAIRRELINIGKIELE